MRHINVIEILIAFIIFFWFSSQTMAFECDNIFLRSPTSKEYTNIRSGVGEFNANRSGGKKHKGVDLIINGSYTDKKPYAVYVVGDGIVAYARLNEGYRSGYGYTVIVDHQNGIYSVYAHLAGDSYKALFGKSALKVKFGDHVSAGDIIGYIADPGLVGSSGNACKVKEETDRIMLHFELVKAKSGKKSKSTIKKIFNEDNSKRIDPTPCLKNFGYSKY